MNTGERPHHAALHAAGEKKPGNAPTRPGQVDHNGTLGPARGARWQAQARSTKATSASSTSHAAARSAQRCRAASERTATRDIPRLAARLRSERGEVIMRYSRKADHDRSASPERGCQTFGGLRAVIVRIMAQPVTLCQVEPTSFVVLSAPAPVASSRSRLTTAGKAAKTTGGAPVCYLTSAFRRTRPH